MVKTKTQRGILPKLLKATKVLAKQLKTPVKIRIKPNLLEVEFWKGENIYGEISLKNGKITFEGYEILDDEMHTQIGREIKGIFNGKFWIFS